MAEKKKIYKFVGRGDGVAGLKHEVPFELGQRYFKEFAAIEEMLEEKRQVAHSNGGSFIYPYVGGSPGKLLQDCLDRDIYVIVEIDEQEGGGYLVNEKSLKKAMADKVKRYEDKIKAEEAEAYPPLEMVEEKEEVEMIPIKAEEAAEEVVEEKKPAKKKPAKKKAKE